MKRKIPINDDFDYANRRRNKNEKNKNYLGWIIGIFIALALILPYSIVIIDQTEVGVVKVLGKVKPQELDAGLHFIIPFITEVIKMPIYEKTIEMVHDDSIKALTNEGLPVTFDLAVQYRIDPTKADEVYSKLRNYEIWMRNRIRARVRDIIANYKAEDLYTSKREEVQAKVEKTLEDTFSKYGIIITAVLIRNINLPQSIVERIEAKISAKQDAERMQFVIQKEKLEKERKIIEAQGIAEANKIIANSITEKYLYWYWIQTLKQQKSVYYVPIGNNGLPIFKTIDYETTQENQKINNKSIGNQTR